MYKCFLLIIIKFVTFYTSVGWVEKNFPIQFDEEMQNYGKGVKTFNSIPTSYWTYHAMFDRGVDKYFSWLVRSKKIIDAYKASADFLLSIHIQSLSEYFVFISQFFSEMALCLKTRKTKLQVSKTWDIYSCFWLDASRCWWVSRQNYFKIRQSHIRVGKLLSRELPPV